VEQTESPNGEPRIAIVGSGPSGCYTAQFLRKRWADAEIVVFDRLDTPYGLIRYGVAPDHLGTKGIAKQFDRLFARDRVRFAGGVEVGRDVTIDELRADFDAVVLATGLWADRTIDGFHDASGSVTHAGVYGSGTLTRMINGFPARRSDEIRIGRRTVIVGNGNVAVDLVRLLLVSRASLAELGVPEDAIDALQSGPVERIHVVGRSGATAAKFDTAMIRELGKLPDVRFRCDDDLPATGASAGAGAGAGVDASAGVDVSTGAEAKVAALAGLISDSPTIAAREVQFHFGWTPDHLEGDHLEGDERVERAVFRPTSGEPGELTLETDSVCTAVGFTAFADDVLLRSTLESEATDLGRGVLAEGVYCVGWLRRGPVGTIPANRVDARTVADAIIADVESRRGSSTRPLAPLNRPL
jgi:ferredoxin--NADP+ reductase